MNKCLLPSLAASGIVAAMAWGGSKLETYDLNVAFHCTHEIATANLPAADILFVGNSQTGAAIDPIYVEQILSPAHDIRVEKLAIVHANIVALRMLVNDYIENRGAPQLIVFQPMVVRAEHWQSPAGHPIHPRVNIAFQDWGELVEIQSEAVASPTGSWLPAWLERGYRSLPAVWIDRQVERIAATLSFSRVQPYKNFCRTDAKFEIISQWPYGRLPLEEGDHIGFTMDQSKRLAWEHDISQRKSADVLAPSRVFEIDQHQRLLNSMEAAGSEVMLVGYPNLGRSDEDAKEFRDFSIALNRKVIDARDLLTDQESETIKSSFRDPLHLNYIGAEIVTLRIANKVKERVR